MTTDKDSSREQSASQSPVIVNLGPKRYEIGRSLQTIVTEAVTWEDAAERAATLFHPSGAGAEIWGENIGPAAFPADRSIAICAFRYALGRMTTMPIHVAGWLMANKDRLSLPDRELIIREIDEAADKRRLGMDCDVATWLRLRTALLVERAR